MTEHSSLTEDRLPFARRLGRRLVVAAESVGCPIRRPTTPPSRFPSKSGRTWSGVSPCCSHRDPGQPGRLALDRRRIETTQSTAADHGPRPIVSSELPKKGDALGEQDVAPREVICARDAKQTVIVGGPCRPAKACRSETGWTATGERRSRWSITGVNCVHSWPRLW